MSEVVSRHFVVDCPSVPGSGNFNFSNLLQGRVDNACRAVTAAVFLSHGMRQDTRISLVLPHPKCEQQQQQRPQGGGRGGGGRNDRFQQQRERPQHPEGAVAPAQTVTVTWSGPDLVGVWPDEKSVATKLQRALCYHFKIPCPVPGDKFKKEEPISGVKGVTIVEDKVAVEPGAPPKLGHGYLGAVERAAKLAGSRPSIILLDEAGAPKSQLEASAKGWACSNGSTPVTAVTDSGDSQPVAPTGFVFAIGGPDSLPTSTAKEVAAIEGATTLRLPGPSLHAGVVVSLAHHILDCAVDESGRQIDTAPAGAKAVAEAKRKREAPTAQPQEENTRPLAHLSKAAGRNEDSRPSKKQRTEPDQQGSRSTDAAPSSSTTKIDTNNNKSKKTEDNRSAAEKVEALYRKHNPQKVCKVEKLLKVWKGTHDELLEQLIEKWGPVPEA